MAGLRGLAGGWGGVLAAATSSLPERLEGARNYDYRYAWIRDQCYAGLAVAAHGPHPLLAGAVRFVTERLLDDRPDLMPAYTVTGNPIPGERALRLLADADRLESIAELVGAGSLPEAERLVLLTAKILREGVLQQSSSSANDAHCDPAKQVALLDLVLAIADAHDATVSARARSGGGLGIDVGFPSPG